MAEFCLLPDKVEDFKKALKDKTLDLAKLLDPKMTSEQRTELFRPYAGDVAPQVNQLFESKLVLKNRVLGLENFVSKLGEIGKYSPEGKAALKQAVADYKAAQTKRIFSPTEHETFLNDLANKAVGTHIDRDVAQRVFELSAEADRLKNIDPKMSGVSDEYLQAKNALNAYVQTQKDKAASYLESTIGNAAITGRNVKLLSPATPIKVTINQAVNHTMDLATRRLASQSLTGAASDLARQAKSEAWQTYVRTGVDTSKLEKLADVGLNKLGERLSFSGVSTGGNALVRRAAQITQKVAIDWEHNPSFTKFHQMAFFDGANIWATKVAAREGLDAKDVFADAVRIEPQTEAGAVVRAIAQRDAARITSTNDTWLSHIALGIKSTLNKINPTLHIGDFIVPMAKIPATVIANGIENAGAGIPFGIKDIVQGRMKLRSTDMATRLEGLAQQAAGIQRLTRIAGVIGTAALFTSALGKNDFRVDKYGNTYVHIAGHWVATEYFAYVSPALAGMMMAKATGNLANYVTGASLGLLKAPGFDELPKLAQAVTNKDMEKGLLKYGKGFLGGLFIPPVVTALTSNNPIEELLAHKHGFESDAEVRQDEIDAARKRALSRAGLN